MFTIAPGETAIYAWDLKILSPGPFETGATLYVYDTHLGKVGITVRGVAVASGGATNAPAQP